MSTTRDQQRESLVNQARHLIHEVEAMTSHVGFIPDEILSTSPLEHEPTIKDVYALIGQYDRHVYLPTLQKMVAENEPAISEGDDRSLLSGRNWNDEPFEDVLSFVRDERARVVGFLASLSADAWNRAGRLGDRNLTVYDVVYAMAQHDAELLKTVAVRLHESRLHGSSAPRIASPLDDDA